MNKQGCACQNSPPTCGRATSDVHAITSHGVMLGFHALRFGFSLVEGGLAVGLRAVGGCGVGCGSGCEAGCRDDCGRGFLEGAEAGGAASPDLEGLAQEIGNLTGKLSTRSLQFLITAVQELKPCQSPARHPVRHDPVSIFVEIRGKRNVVADTLVVQRPREPTLLFVPRLDSADSSPPLTNIQFLVTRDGEHIRAVVTVPEDQPAGVYVGPVFDEARRTPLGQMRVKIP